MKWIADENVDLDIVLRLRTTGHDVVFIGESQSGMDDKDILELADSEQRIVITSDKDFGELVYRNKLAHHGILLLRLAELDPATVPEIVCQFIEAHHEELSRKYSVMSPGHVRIRPMSN